MILSRELKSLRVKNGYTQKQFAKEMGMGETSYSKRENGLISFTTTEIKKLKQLLNISDKDIIMIFFNDSVALKTTTKAKKSNKSA